MTGLISIVICTHNRAECLRDAIQSVCDQEYLPDDFEIIVVDNASMDDTPRVAQGFCDKYPFIRYIMEPNVGLSHARNRGWQEAHSDYVAYLDDDAKASPAWLEVASLVIQNVAPAALGGPYIAFHTSEKPFWFKDQYGSRSLGDQPGHMDRRFLSGGNLFVKRDVLSRLGGFDSTLGMAGDRVAYAEEVLLQRRIRDEIPGAIIYYHPDILIYHLVRAEKYSLRWRLSSSFASGRDFYFANLEKEKLVFRIISTVKVLIEFLGVLSGFVIRNRKQYPFWQNYVYEPVNAWVGRLGRAYASWVYTVQSAFQPGVKKQL